MKIDVVFGKIVAHKSDFRKEKTFGVWDRIIASNGPSHGWSKMNGKRRVPELV